MKHWEIKRRENFSAGKAIFCGIAKGAVTSCISGKTFAPNSNKKRL